MKLISLTIAMLTIMLASGCSVKEGAIKVIGTVNGGHIDTTKEKLQSEGFAMSKKVDKLKLSKDKGYVIFTAPDVLFEISSILYEDVGNGELSLAMYLPEDKASFVFEFEPGKHTIVGNSAQGAFRSTYNIKAGYVYYVKVWDLGKRSIWTYGWDQIILRIDRDRLEDSRESGKLSYYKDRTYMLDTRNLEKVNEVINTYTIKKDYNKFIKWHNEFPEDEKEDDVFYKYTDYTLDIKDAWKIPEKYFKN